MSETREVAMGDQVVTRELAEAPRASAKRMSRFDPETGDFETGWIARLAGRNVVHHEGPKLHATRDEAVDAARKVREHARQLLSDPPGGTDG